MIRLFILVEDISAVMAAGYTLIRVYTDSSSSGTFTTLNGTVALVSGQESYEYTDLTGTSSTWYKTAYYGAGPGLSDKSAARKGETSSAYGTVKEMRAHMDKTLIADDWELAQLLDAATRNIDRACNRPDGFVASVEASTRIYCGTGDHWLRIDECVSISQVRAKPSPTSSYETWASSDYLTATGDPRFPDYNSSPIELLRIDPNGNHSHWYYAGTYPNIEITARWGFSLTVPDDIKAACIMQAVRWHKRLQSGMSDTLGSIDLGTLLFTQSLDPDIERMLVHGRYVRPAL